MNSEVRVRIAPSPTGYLHIGTVRTALFNFLFAKKNNGKFLLRIEDTDEARNNEQSYDSILNGLEFLGLKWDEEVVYQKQQLQRHIEVAQKLIQNGSAYYCYLSQDEIVKRKQKAEESGTKYIHKHSKQDEIPVDGVNPVIRIKAPYNQEIINHDLVQGKVVINSNTIEDFVIIRNDNTPIYMLSVVCDDIEMKITYVIRGDDHLTNTAKQILIYNGLNVKPPFFAHIPLIHGMDGKKLSKRHGALAVEEYKNMGYLPEALRSYLVRLGWGSENDNILNDDEMIKEFSIEGISKSPSRFDFEKLKNINHHFIVNSSVDAILKKVLEDGNFINIDRIKKAVEKIRYRYSTILDMKTDFSCFEDSFTFSSEAKEVILQGKDYLNICIDFFTTHKNHDNLEAKFKDFLKQQNINFGKVGPVLRASLIGKISSIGIFEIVYVLGIDEVIRRLNSAL